jgi:transposase-like protein
MATRQQFELNTNERRKRVFSEDFKIKKVQEIERKQTTVLQVSKAYQVRQNNVYRWIEKYSKTYKKGVRLVVEMESETRQLLNLRAKVAELERIIGQKQLTIDFQAKMIDLAEEAYGIDIKKKSENKPSSTSGNTENNSTAV